MSYKFIRDFSALNIEEEFIPGSINLFMGEAHRFLEKEKINLPAGFMITSRAFDALLDHEQNRANLLSVLSGLDSARFSNLKETGRLARALILSFDLPEPLQKEISEAKSKLLHPQRSSLRLAVRCVECGEKQDNNNAKDGNELLLNISGEDELLKSSLKCYSTLFSDMLIRYRAENNRDQLSGQMNILVQKMVRSDLACSGIMYRPDKSEQDDDAIAIEGCWGLVENIEHGIIIPDVFRITGPKKTGPELKPVIQKTKGSKAKTLIYFDMPDLTKEATYVNIETQESKRLKYVLSDAELLKLADWMHIIESRFNEPVKVKWAKDGFNNELFVVEANVIQ